MELFEQIRREYEHGAGTIKGVARKLGIHRRMVREALADAMPRDRKKPEREKPKRAAGGGRVVMPPDVLGQRWQQVFLEQNDGSSSRLNEGTRALARVPIRGSHAESVF